MKPTKCGSYNQQHKYLTPIGSHINGLFEDLEPNYNMDISRAVNIFGEKAAS
jgi:hypothetical protein